MKFPHVAAACVMSAALLADVAPAGAFVTCNSLSQNALSANSLAANALANNSLSINALSINALSINALTQNALALNAIALTGSSLGELNGVTVEAVSRHRIDGVEPGPGDKTGEIVLDQLSQVDPGNYR